MSNSSFNDLNPDALTTNASTPVNSSNEEPREVEELGVELKLELSREIEKIVRLFHLTDTTVLAKLRKAFAFKLFRLIKAWLAGTAIFLIFVTVHNQMIAALLVLSIFLGICASLLNDKVYEFRVERKFDAMNNSKKDDAPSAPITPLCQHKVATNIGLHLPYIPMLLSGFCFVYAMLLLLPCWWSPVCTDITPYAVGKDSTIVRADTTVIITLITTTTATVIGLFIIAARWLFKHPSDEAEKKDSK
jgi:hypothetical protein